MKFWYGKEEVVTPHGHVAWASDNLPKRCWVQWPMLQEIGQQLSSQEELCVYRKRGNTKLSYMLDLATLEYSFFSSSSSSSWLLPAPSSPCSSETGRCGWRGTGELPPLLVFNSRAQSLSLSFSFPSAPYFLSLTLLQEIWVEFL